MSMPEMSERAKVRVVLMFAGIAGLLALLVATGRGNDQRELYDRFFLYLPASAFLLFLVLVITDLYVGVIERRSTAQASVARMRVALVIGLAVSAALLATVLLLWFT